MNSRILITGATGNIGQALTEILSEKNLDFTRGVYAQRAIAKNHRNVFSDFSIIRNTFNNITRKGLVPFLEFLMNYK